MVTSFSLISLLTITVCVTCVYRLIDYHRRGVLRFSEIKSVFHVALLIYGTLGLPYDVFCLANYNVWQVGYGSTHAAIVSTSRLLTFQPRHFLSTPLP